MAWKTSRSEAKKEDVFLFPPDFLIMTKHVTGKVSLKRSAEPWSYC